MEMSEQSKALLDLYLGGAAELGMTVGSEFTGGSADSGVAAAQGTPTLCGLGAVGGKIHGPEEYIEVDSIVPRAQALARVIGRLGDSTL
jgi:glutamate carboxypeptidase